MDELANDMRRTAKSLAAMSPTKKQKQLMSFLKSFARKNKVQLGSATYGEYGYRKYPDVEISMGVPSSTNVHRFESILMRAVKAKFGKEMSFGRHGHSDDELNGYVFDMSASDEVTDDQIKARLETLRIPNDQDEDAERNGQWWTRMFRNRDFFTERYDEEDDDWPEFTGYDIVERKVNEHFEAWLKGGLVEVEVTGEEKSWFSVSVRDLS